METALNGLIIIVITSLILALACEALLRIKSKLYNVRRKNPLMTYSLGGSTESDFIQRYTGIRTFFICLTLGSFFVLGILSTMNVILK